MRKPFLVLLFYLAGFCAILSTLIDAHTRQPAAEQGLARRIELVHQLGLSDLALFTEARYTRHLALADRHSAFQNNPAALDQFPSGSTYQPPQQLKP